MEIKRSSSGLLAGLLAAAVLVACAAGERSEVSPMDSKPAGPGSPAKVEVATFGEGCFWCVEAIFERIEGVISVESGYAGGTVANPTYRDVCSGETGHAEVCQIHFDPSKVSYEDLLEVFWKTHDPTTPNRQGADVGTQYRSAIFYHDARQKERAETSRKALEAAGVFDAPIVTEIVPFTAFYPAEDYHQEYYDQNRSQPYCRLVIAPKIEKLEKVFADKLKR